MRADHIFYRAWLLPALFLLIYPSDLFSQVKAEISDSVKIGLLVPDNHSGAAVKGAQLAVVMANRNRKIPSIPFKLIVRTMEGPWGTGSTRAVSLVFDEKVTALLGSHDGRNAHLVEQVAAKSRVVFVSAWSADPTLAQAFVPWFFNCVHDDFKQSEAIAEDVYSKHKFRKPVIISDECYESVSSLKNFMKKIRESGYPAPLQLSYQDNEEKRKELLSAIKSSGSDCFILFIRPGMTAGVISELSINETDKPVYCTLAQLDEDLPAVDGLKKMGGCRIVSSLDLISPKGKEFASEFRKSYGYDPGPVAAYAFDGMNLLIAAIEKGGTEREVMQTALNKIEYEGATGLIRFDGRGSRLGIPGFVTLKNGLVVSAKY